MKYAVVTGATSFIGVHLVNELLEKKYYVYAIVRPNSNNMSRLPSNSNLEIVSLDLSEIALLANYIPAPVDTFFHLAWEGARAPQRDDFALQQTNYMYAIKAMKAAKQLECKTFVGAGSQAEYGIVDEIITEECEENPTTMYGKSKLQTFREGLVFSEKVGMRFVWPRIFSVYGPNDFAGTLIMSCIDKMQKNQSIDLTPCSQLWDFLYVGDAAMALVKLGEAENARGIYNIASGKALPLREFVLEMKNILHSNSILNFGAIAVEPKKIVGFAPSIDKLSTAISWCPKISFADGIEKIIKAMVIT